MPKSSHESHSKPKKKSHNPSLRLSISGTATRSPRSHLYSLASGASRNASLSGTMGSVSIPKHPIMGQIQNDLAA